MAVSESGNLRDHIWEVAQRIGLERSELTLRALNTGPPGPVEYLTEHLRLIGAWSEAVALLRHEAGVSE